MKFCYPADGQRKSWGDTACDEADTCWLKDDFLLNSIDKGKVIAVIRENKEIFMSGLTGGEFGVGVHGMNEIPDMLQSKKQGNSQGIEGCVWTVVIAR